MHACLLTDKIYVILKKIAKNAMWISCFPPLSTVITKAFIRNEQMFVFLKPNESVSGPI